MEQKTLHNNNGYNIKYVQITNVTIQYFILFVSAPTILPTKNIKEPNVEPLDLQATSIQKAV